MIPLPYRLFAIVSLFLLAACGSTQPASPVPAIAETYIPIIAASELQVGPNRIPLGILNQGTPINQPDLEVTLTFFYLDGPEPDRPQFSAQAVYRGQGLPFGLYVAQAELPTAGGWIAEVALTPPSGATQASRVRLDVLADSPIPAVGEAAIPSQNLTLAEQSDLAQLTSDGQPDPDFYRLSIAEALAQQRPFVVMFATPGYCQTAVCSPNMAVLKQLKATYQDRVAFLHVEVYPYPFGASFEQGLRVPAMDEWALRTEPWTFVVDRAGLITARYEGGLTFAELEPVIAALAGS